MGEGAHLMGHGAPQQMQMVQAAEAYKMLASLPSVKIVEKMNVLETAAGLLGDMLGQDIELEMANKYLIQTGDGHPFLFAVEQTDVCNRNCCPDCRAIDVDIVILGQDPRVLNAATGYVDWNFSPLGAGVDLRNSTKFLHLHKDFQCTCCCFNRPIIDVTNGTTGELLGRIRDPFACCDMTFAVEDPSGDQILSAKGGCCQLGLICPCPCGPCREVHFPVEDAKTGQEVGKLTKIVPDCLKFLMADDVDNYEVEFGAVQNPQYKALMIALGLFIDFRYFNARSENHNDDDGSGSGSGSE